MASSGKRPAQSEPFLKVRDIVSLSQALRSIVNHLHISLSCAADIVGHEVHGRQIMFPVHGNDPRFRFGNIRSNTRRGGQSFSSVHTAL